MTLQIEHATIGYGNVDVLRDVEARAEPGRVTAVIGTNAAGKTTLLRCAAGLLDPKRGKVVLDGQSIHARSPRWIAQRVAYMPQRPRVSGGLSVHAVVDLGRYAMPPDGGAVTRAIERLDLAHVAQRPFAELSVGQQQRVVLARALAQTSAEGVLILDEPTAAVDLAHTRDLARLLREVADGGATVLCSMHDLTLAAAIADDVWLVHDRRLESGIATEMMQPKRLSMVFGVAFSRLTGSGGSEVLIADVG